MKKIITLLLIASPCILFSQMVVVLNHNGNSSLFSTTQPFVDAYNASVNGDTIYLPGGPFTPPPGIDKRLTIIGAGHYPDSSAVTGITTIPGNLNLLSNADRTILQGLYVTGTIIFENNSRIDSVTIYRCNASILFQGNFDLANNCRNVLLYQNVIPGLTITHTSDIRIFNNIISSLVSIPSGAWIRNNKINSLQSINYSLIENNTIEGTYDIQFNSFRNNVLPFAIPADNNTWLNNYPLQPFASLFVNYTAWFSYMDDYHFQNPGSYPGTDALPVGIYGGFYPYKTAAVPSNPHIQSKIIPLQPDVNGQLNIQVKVAAQNN